MTTGSMHRNVVKIGTQGFQIMRVYEQTDRHTYSSQYFAVHALPRSEATNHLNILVTCYEEVSVFTILHCSGYTLK